VISFYKEPGIDLGTVNTIIAEGGREEHAESGADPPIGIRTHAVAVDRARLGAGFPHTA
jgi:hypothetical protein